MSVAFVPGHIFPQGQAQSSPGEAVPTAWPLSENFEIYFNDNSRLYKTQNRGRRRFRKKELVPF